jgi:hypothetical protein
VILLAPVANATIYPSTVAVPLLFAIASATVIAPSSALAEPNGAKRLRIKAKIDTMLNIFLGRLPII